MRFISLILFISLQLHCAQSGFTPTPSRENQAPTAPEKIREGAKPSGNEQTIGTVTRETMGDNQSLEPEAYVSNVGRPYRRLGVEQLEDSIRVLAGGSALQVDIQWTGEDQNGGYPIEQSRFHFQQAGQALGRSDKFDTVIRERQSIDALYAKFSGDMAAQVCEKMIEADQSRPHEKRRFLRRDVNQALRELSLIFLGKRVFLDEDVQDLRQVYNQVLLNTQNQNKAWAAVCMSLFLTPSFHIY
jgi:hypothetical protein